MLRKRRFISFHLPGIPVRSEAYSGRFRDVKFEAELLSDLSSLPWLEEQGWVCNPPCTQHIALQTLHFSLTEA